MNEIIRNIESKYKKDNIPSFTPGDRVKLYLRVIEGNNERIQVFEGDVIGRKGTGIGENITIRKVSYGIGVERIISLHSPKIAKIEVVRRGSVRRAKLYYLREKVGKASRIKEKIDTRTKKNK